MRTDRQTDMTKLVVALRKFVNAPKAQYICFFNIIFAINSQWFYFSLFSPCILLYHKWNHQQNALYFFTLILSYPDMFRRRMTPSSGGKHVGVRQNKCKKIQCILLVILLVSQLFVYLTWPVGLCVRSVLSQRWNWILNVRKDTRLQKDACYVA
jgi:hypothetical protein